MPIIIIALLPLLPLKLMQINGAQSQLMPIMPAMCTYTKCQWWFTPSTNQKWTEV